MAEKNAAQIMSEGALKVKFEDLSEKNIRYTKDKLIDNIGNIAGGALAFGNREVKAVIESYGEKGEAPIFVLGGRASLGDAAMVNAMSSRSNDFEPMFMNLNGVRWASKESATLINAVLTAGAVYGFSGKDYITHEIVAEDLSVRIMAAGGRWNFDVGYDSSFTMPVYGVCAAFARMRGLNALQLRDAWGMAMGMVGGTISHIYDYATSAKLGAGYNIRNADFATRLAAKDFSSLNNIFEGPRNLYRQYRGMEEACSPEYLYSYGDKFYMEESIKLYPVGTPATIVAFAGSELSGCVKPEDIKDITLEFCMTQNHGYYWPDFELGRDPLTHAQFSYQYALAAPLKYGKFGINLYRESVLRDPEVLKLCNMTRLLHSPDLEQGEIRATVYAKDGTKHSIKKTPKDFSMHDYPTREQLLDKFWAQINEYGLISKAKADKCIQLADRLEDLKDMRELTSLLEG